MRHLIRFISLFLILLLAPCAGILAKPIVYQGGKLIIGPDVAALTDAGNALSPEQALQAPGYRHLGNSTPNFNISNATHWLRFTIVNGSEQSRLLLEIDNPLIDTCQLFKIVDGRPVLYQDLGMNRRFDERTYQYTNLVFDLGRGNDTVQYLMRIRSNEQLIVPMILGSSREVADSQNSRNLIYGIHIGILLVMILYNFFIFISIRDRSYLFYVSYILFIGLSQTTLSGYTFKYLFPNHPGLLNQGIIWFPALAGIFAILFIRSFLHTRSMTPRLDRWLLVVATVYLMAGITRLLGFDLLSSRMVDIVALFAAVVVYMVVGQLWSRYRPARFFCIAWSIFILGLVLYVLRNLGILPYGTFTNYTMQAGTALEVTLLSIALADKINILQREKRASQERALMALQENERIVREQNAMLEAKVHERTLELQQSNTELNHTLSDLKEAQSQLIEQEKMASLGQLTAGIAHEINNPINFVTSNVKPLKRDIVLIMELFDQLQAIAASDAGTAEKVQQINALKEEHEFDYLKTEIDYLLQGIHEGSQRTADIVKGLRIFSRLDEDDLKKADINEGLDSTLIIVNNLLNNRITAEKEYGSLPLVECYPGKLNQVFLNILTNAVHAINKKFNGEHGGRIRIKTWSDDTNAFISFQDNGTGMDEQTRKKLFEPFFTTKEVGEGTGLGMSIAYNTIRKHNGQIHISSEPGAGTEFTLEIPIVQHLS